MCATNCSPSSMRLAFGCLLFWPPPNSLQLSFWSLLDTHQKTGHPPEKTSHPLIRAHASHSRADKTSEALRGASIPGAEAACGGGHRVAGSQGPVVGGPFRAGEARDQARFRRKRVRFRRSAFAVRLSGFVRRGWWGCFEGALLFFWGGGCGF